MIVIVDDNTERGLALRHSALSAFLPCAFCSVSEFVHFPHGKDIVVLCADREDQLSALGSADKAELIVINHTGKNIINTDAYFYSEENDGDLVQFLKARAAALCGNDADTPSYGGIYFNPEGKVVFCGRKFALTRLERTIVLLLIFGMREWYTAEDIVRSLLCKDDAGDKKQYGERPCFEYKFKIKKSMRKEADPDAPIRRLQAQSAFPRT